MIQDHFLNITEEEYRKRGMHYSIISNYEKGGFNALKKLFDRIDTPSLSFGSAVDALITGGRDEFDRNFAVYNMPEISDSLKAIAQELFNINGNRIEFDDIDDETLASVGERQNYYAGSNYKATRVKNIRKSCKAYYNILKLSNNKKVLDDKTYEKVLKCVETLKNAPATKQFFMYRNGEVDDFFNTETYYQPKFSSVIDGIEYVCMFDVLIIDNEKKCIYPIDLKTSSSNEYEFQDTLLKWRYDIQARLYTKILAENIKNDKDLEGYEVKPFKFVVINKDNLLPLVWEFPLSSAEGDLYVDGSDIILRDPIAIGKELNYYLTNPVQVPLGINIRGVNYITNIKCSK